MSIGQSLIPEFDHETAVTRRFLERIPEDKLSWTPHEKSMTLGRLADHLATIVGWFPATIEHDELDLAPVGGEPWVSPTYTTNAERLAAFDATSAKARVALAEVADDKMFVDWALKSAGQTHFSMPRIAVLRSFCMNHVYHHRGQLSVYLRLLGVPVPSAYGPTADEAM